MAASYPSLGVWGVEQTDPGVAEHAPYLVEFPPNHELCDQVLRDFWGSSWGILVGLPFHVELRALRKHLRTFLLVKNHKGKLLFFRYFDPRVFSVYLQTCNASEAEHVFGPVSWYAMESERGLDLLRFKRDEVQIMLKRVALTE